MDLVCSDIFHTGAFDKLKQNVILFSISFNSSYKEKNNVKIAEVISKFKKEKYELII